MSKPKTTPKTKPKKQPELPAMVHAIQLQNDADHPSVSARRKAVVKLVRSIKV